MRTLLALLLCFTFAASAMEDPPLNGTWEDKEKGLSILFKTQADGRTSGTITKGSARFQIDALGIQGPADNPRERDIQGTFLDSSDNTHKFTAQLRGDKLTFTTGHTTYNLARANPGNPLGDLGGEAPATNPLENLGGNNPPQPNPQPQPNPNPNTNPNPPANNAVGDVYKHKTGLWQIRPVPGWKVEENPDGNTTKWSHPNGGLIFVTIVPDCPFQNGEEMFAKMTLPGLMQGGAAIQDDSPFENFGVPGHLVAFERTRNDITEYGTQFCAVVKGKGVLFQMTLPLQHKQELGDQMGMCFMSFKVNPQ